MKRLNLKKSIGEMLTKEQMKNVIGGEYIGTCKVEVTCSHGTLSCESTKGKCKKGTNYVQCDDEAALTC